LQAARQSYFEGVTMGNDIEDYIANGWRIVPIAPGSKRPVQQGWQTGAGALASASALPFGYGVGLMHAYSSTMALDIDDWGRTLALGLDVDALAAAPDSVMIHSGKPGHGKLLYRMPFGLVLPSKQIWDNKQAIVNFRCSTADGLTVQDVLPPSIHPDTLQPYQWGGNGHWSRLPVLPASILTYWQASLEVVMPSTVAVTLDTSWDEIRAALAYIDPDCSREDWVQCGMAIKRNGEQTITPDQAFAVWDGWSRQGVKYPGPAAIAQQWRSFRSDKTQLITLGTLFKLAKQGGWVKSTPDVSALFADMSTMTPPADVIDTMKPKPPDIDLSLWPPVLAKRAQEVADTVGCDPIIPLWAGMAAVCGVVDAQSRLELMSGFQVPPILWMMTLGDPGDKKSPGSRPMLEPLKAIESDDKPRYAAARQAWEFSQAVYASAHKSMMKYAESPEGILDPGQAPVVPPEPAQPVPLKITVADITSQELVYNCHTRPRGVLCYLDEMNALVQKITNKMSGENRSTWVVGFESTEYRMDRVSTKATHCENFAVSIYGNMQPQVLEDNFTSLASDGFLQRFLPAVVRHNWSKMGNPIPDFMTTAGKWEATLRGIFAVEQTTYRLAPEAYQVYRSFQEWYEDRMQQERLMKSSNEFIMAFGKITGLVGRLALIFHIIEDPHKPTVSAELMTRVVRIAREYVTPAYRHTFDSEGSSSVFDSWVMEYVVQYADKDTLSLVYIKRGARRPFERADVKTPYQQTEWVISAMYLLEKMNWVARIDDGAKENIGQAEWAINPHLKTTFKAYRDAVVRAKLARNQDRLDRAGSNLPHNTHGADSLQ
jgi:hypothetical protein